MINQTTERERPPTRILTRRRSNIRAWIICLVILGAALAAVWYWVVSPHLGQIIQQQQSGGRRGFMNQAMPVGVADVQTGDLPIVLKGLGTVTPLATVTVKTQINGT